HRDVKVACDGAPRRAVILVRELTARRPYVLERRRPRALAVGVVRGQLDVVVLAVLEQLDVHVPVGHLDGVEHDALGEQRRPRHRHVDVLGGEERTRFRRHALDDEVVHREAAAPQVHAKLADVHRPLDGVGPGGLRALAQRRPEVDRNTGDERDGNRAGKRRHDGAHDAPGPLRQRMVVEGEESAVIHSRITSMAPASTDVPSTARTSTTVPAAFARSSFSIFIASTTTSPWRGSTRSPGCTRTFTIFPGIGAFTCCGPAPGGGLAGRPADGRTGPAAAGVAGMTVTSTGTPST